MIDLAGHIAYSILILGTWYAGKGYASGWLLRMTGDLFWLVLGILLGLSSITIWSAVFFAVDAIAFVRQLRKRL